MQKPPLLPAETFTRVLRLAKLDGTGVLAVAGAFALASAFIGDRLGVVIGLLVAGAGAVELHGASLLKAGAIRGINWLIASQIYLLAAVLGYVALRLVSYDPTLIDYVVTTETRQDLMAVGYDEAGIAHLVEQIYYVSYIVVGVVTFFYQGGMAVYYQRRRAAVAAALAME